MIDLHECGWLNALRSEGPLRSAIRAHQYALVDCVFCAQCFDAVQRHVAPTAWQSLYRDTPGASDELIANSPLLVALNQLDPTALDQMLKPTDGLPMLSLIDSDESLEPLAQRLARWCIVDADGQNFLLRFADTRRLPDVLRVLREDQRVQLCGPGARWHFRARNATWQLFEAPVPSEAPLACPTRPQLDGHQCAALISASEPDELAANLLHFNPALGQALAPSLRFALSSRAVDASNAMNLTTQAERMALCELFWQEPALAEVPDHDTLRHGSPEPWLRGKAPCKRNH